MGVKISLKDKVEKVNAINYSFVTGDDGNATDVTGSIQPEFVDDDTQEVKNDGDPSDAGFTADEKSSLVAAYNTAEATKQAALDAAVQAVFAARTNVASASIIATSAASTADSTDTTATDTSAAQ
jgi:hypothetical protein